MADSGFYNCQRKEMLPAVAVSVSGGKGSPLLHYEQQVHSWHQVANVEPTKRDPASILQMGSAARQVCMSAGVKIILSNYGASQISNTSHEHFAPATAYAVFQEGPGDGAVSSRVSRPAAQSRIEIADGWRLPAGILFSITHATCILDEVRGVPGCGQYSSQRELPNWPSRCLGFS